LKGEYLSLFVSELREMTTVCIVFCNTIFLTTLPLVRRAISGYPIPSLDRSRIIEPEGAKH